jgi:peptide/nickel transport system substrate-binding protein
MKRLIGVLSAGLLASLSAAMAQEQPQRGGTLTYGISAEAPTFDCGGTDTFAVIHTVAPFYSTLLKVDVTNYPNVIGDLAKSWTISPDGKTYTFELNSPVSFHDGSPLTSEDIKATYDRYRNPPAGVPSFRRGTFADITAIETPSPTTVVFKLKQPNPAMLLNLATPNGCIYSAKKLAEDPRFPIMNIMGSGPFKFTESVKGSHIAGVRFDNYFRQGLPYLDGFRGVLFSQSSAMVNAIQGGQILGEFRTVSPADQTRLQSAMGNAIKFYEQDWSTGLVIVFNTKKAPFNDPKVRRALSMAVDRLGASQGLRKTAVLRGVGGIIRPGAPFQTPPADVAKWAGFGPNGKADKEEAQRLLKEAGVTDLKITLLNRATNQPYTIAGVYLIDQWKRVGVTAEHRQLETAQYREAVRSGNFDIVLDFHNALPEDPTLTLTRYVSDSPDNFSGAVDKEVDAMFEEQMHETDAKKREAIVRKMELRILNEASQVPFIWWYRTVALSSRIKGWHMSPSHLFGQDLAEVWLAPEPKS